MKSYQIPNISNSHNSVLFIRDQRIVYVTMSVGRSVGRSKIFLSQISQLWDLIETGSFRVDNKDVKGIGLMMMTMMMLMMMMWKDDADGALDPWSCLNLATSTLTFVLDIKVEIAAIL